VRRRTGNRHAPGAALDGEASPRRRGALAWRRRPR
jgi:hypothetical protein